jgi:exonuclease III
MNTLQGAHKIDNQIKDCNLYTVHEQSSEVDCSPSVRNSISIMAGNGLEDINLHNLNIYDNDCPDANAPLRSLNQKLKNKIGLKISQLNVRSLYPKIEEIRFLLESTNFDIFCITESWLDSTISNSEIQVDGYDIIRRDRNRNGGGVALYVNENITYKVREDLSLDNIECLWVEVPGCEDKTPILVCVMYRPPSADSEYYEHMIDCLSRAVAENNDILVLGDLNYDYKLDDNLNTNPINYLENLFMLTQLITEPTRVTLKKSSTLDIILTSMPNNHKITGVYKVSLSDHYMTYTIVSRKTGEHKHKSVKFRDYKNFNIDDYIDDIDRCPALNSIHENTNVDNAWDIWFSNFMNICDKHAPMRECRVKDRCNPWITPEIIKMMYKRDYLHRKALANNDKSLWDEYKQIRNHITSFIKKAKYAHYDTLIENSRSKPKYFWKELSKLVPNKFNNTSIPKNMSAKDFNTYFSSIGSETAKEFGSSNKLLWKGPTSIYEFKFQVITRESIQKHLRSMGNESSNDLYNVDGKLLKIAADKITPHLTFLFNLSLTEGIMPKAWKLSQVTPIYKGKGETHEHGNYRPISIICHIGKIMEREIYKQFLHYLTEHAFISIDQSAYLKHHSTQTSLHRVVDDWLENMNNGQITGLCFLDIQKCFDTIDHELLLSKLKCYGIKNNELTWFTSYLSDRKQKVRCNGDISSELDISIGVPQGSVLGPFLFLLFANDLGSFVLDGFCNCFADDTVIYVSGNSISEVTNKLQKCLDNVQYWYSQNRLKVNASKSNIMLMGTPRKLAMVDRANFKINYNKAPLSSTDVIRYLGLFVDQNLTWDNHISKVCRQVAPKLAMLRRLSAHTPKKLLSKIYITYIQPILEYSCTVWGYTSEKNLKKIQRLQNYAARIVCNNYDYINTRGIELIERLKWQDFKQRRDFLTSTLMFKCVNGMVPVYLADSVTLAKDVCDRNTRNSLTMNVSLPMPNIEQFKNSLIYAGGQQWNGLTNALKESDSLDSFKRQYKEQYW